MNSFMYSLLAFFLHFFKGWTFNIWQERIVQLVGGGEGELGKEHTQYWQMVTLHWLLPSGPTSALIFPYRMKSIFLLDSKSLNFNTLTKVSAISAYHPKYHVIWRF